MSVIDIELAMKHLLAEDEDKALVQAQLDAAEEAAMQFL
ncbi:phage gp6-like head-tail connector protein, partial [Pseudomonas sp. CA3A]|nr:phage gp6-like head-tail connector protein [Pseudomonas typographi]